MPLAWHRNPWIFVKEVLFETAQQVFTDFWAGLGIKPRLADAKFQYERQ
jgi:hypothetical protein